MKKIILAMFIFLPIFAHAEIKSDLKMGSKGVEVIELQNFLITKGFLKGEASGNYFSLTRKAVIAYQVSTGIRGTGFVGPMTRNKMNSEIGKALTVSINANSNLSQISAINNISTTTQEGLSIQARVLEFQNKVNLGLQTSNQNNSNQINQISPTYQTELLNQNIPNNIIINNNIAPQNIQVELPKIILSKIQVNDIWFSELNRSPVPFNCGRLQNFMSQQISQLNIQPNGDSTEINDIIFSVDTPNIVESITLYTGFKTLGNGKNDIVGVCSPSSNYTECTIPMQKSKMSSSQGLALTVTASVLPNACSLTDTIFKSNIKSFKYFNGENDVLINSGFITKPVSVRTEKM